MSIDPIVEELDRLRAEQMESYHFDFEAFYPGPQGAGKVVAAAGPSAAGVAGWRACELGWALYVAAVSGTPDRDEHLANTQDIRQTVRRLPARRAPGAGSPAGVVERLVRSPEALANVLEAAGPLTLEQTGALLDERIPDPAS